MTLTLSTEVTDQLATALDAYDSGVLEIRSGAPPGPDLAASGTLLASISLPADAFSGPSNDGQLQLSGTWEDTSADAAGTAGHFRLKTSTDTNVGDGTEERIEGTIGGTGSGEDMELDNTSIATGQTVTINTFTLTMPTS